MSSNNVVIVFGPTGNVGSATARTARDHGAKVILAMRDTMKKVPGIDTEEEKRDGFERVQADLTQPPTIVAAVEQWKAKSAFIYRTHGVADNMKAALEALKSAGIQFVVLLSSYTVTGDPKEISPSELVPYIHAQVEINLEEIFGPEGYMAVRPGSFATNTKRWADQIRDGQVKLYYPNAKFDYVTPADIGLVCGSFLAKGRQDTASFEYVFGPERISQAEAAKAIAAALGLSITIESISQDEEINSLIGGGFPEIVAKYVVTRLKDLGEGQSLWYNQDRMEHVAKNFERLTGKPPMALQTWAEQSKNFFSS